MQVYTAKKLINKDPLMFYQNDDKNFVLGVKDNVTPTGRFVIDTDVFYSMRVIEFCDLTRILIRQIKLKALDGTIQTETPKTVAELIALAKHLLEGQFDEQTDPTGQIRQTFLQFTHRNSFTDERVVSLFSDYPPTMDGEDILFSIAEDNVKSYLAMG